MKFMLAAIVASFAVSSVALAEDDPMARSPAPISCAMSGLAHHTSYQGAADDIPDQALCPQFLSTDRLQLPHGDLRT